MLTLTPRLHAKLVANSGSMWGTITPCRVLTLENCRNLQMICSHLDSIKPCIPLCRTSSSFKKYFRNMKCNNISNHNFNSLVCIIAPFIVHSLLEWSLINITTILAIQQLRQLIQVEAGTHHGPHVMLVYHGLLTKHRITNLSLFFMIEIKIFWNGGRLNPQTQKAGSLEVFTVFPSMLL